MRKQCLVVLAIAALGLTLTGCESTEPLTAESAIITGDLANPPKEKVYWYGRAIEMDPYLVQAYVKRGAANNQMGKPAEAASDCSTAIELDPYNADAHRYLAEAYDRLDQGERAIEHYTKAIELSPSNIDAYNGRGDTHLRLGERDMAIADYTTAIALDDRRAGLVPEAGARVSGRALL